MLPLVFVRKFFLYLVTEIKKVFLFCLPFIACISCDISYFNPHQVIDENVDYKSSLIASFVHSDYPYATYNQSLAVWSEKAFCFNDTKFADDYGFCVIIDTKTGSVIERITQVPDVVALNGGGPSHLNNACFTDQFFKPSDNYPLLLLSRGDYPNSLNKRGEELYVFRITEINNSFSFEHIKTIVTKHSFLTTHNPTWEYDSSRKMIWGHCLTEDWRWCEHVSPLYRSFNMPDGMYFKAYGASYVCIESRDAALSNCNVTITIGEETKTVSVRKGDRISEVFRYVENNGGCCFIKCGQQSQSFKQKFDVYTCDKDGNNKSLIVLQVGIVGFKAPDLSDSTTVIVNDSDFTQPKFIDEGIVQGGACYDGKLFIPFHSFKEINGKPSKYLSPVCLIIDPMTGIIERFIKLSSEREPEGCAFYNGTLFISHHNGGATNETKDPSFELFKYTFD